MSDLVPSSDQIEQIASDQIEQIVGIERHETKHYGRLIPAEKKLYVLHSKMCRDAHSDLRACIYSQYMDHNGIDPVLAHWEGFEDRPVQLQLMAGYVLPHQLEVR